MSQGSAIAKSTPLVTIHVDSPNKAYPPVSKGGQVACIHRRWCTVHPHTSKPIPQSELNAITIENQRVLIRQLESRVRAQQERIQVLEMLDGYEKLGLRAEIENLRWALKDLSAT